MARPQKNNAEYFPHFASMRNHRKVKVLRNKFGSVLGYAFWCMMLEWLTEQDGLEWEFSDLECEMFAAELGVSAAEIPPLIDFCLKIELLFKTESGFIYSESLNENLAAVFEKRKREKERSKTRKRRENGVFANDNTTTGGVSAAEIPQSKVKEIKVKESKEEETNKAASPSFSTENSEKKEKAQPLPAEHQKKAAHTGGAAAADPSETITLPFASEAFSNLWQSWKEHRKSIRKQYKSLQSEQAALMQLSEFEEEFATGLIKQSIANGWQGLIFGGTARDYQEFKKRKYGNQQYTPAHDAGGNGNNADLEATVKLARHLASM